MRKLFSHPLDPAVLGWPGDPTFIAEPYSKIAEGAVANTFILHIFNHFGTHMDAPKHYNDNGKMTIDFPLDTFFFEKPLLLDIPKGRAEKVMRADLEPFAEKLADCDFLFVRTGFEKMRTVDPLLYQNEGPAMSSEACRYLIENYRGRLRGLAVDFLSLASPLDTVDGGEAHRFLCSNYYQENIFIVEDAHMAELDALRLKSAVVIPLFMAGVDSSPVTAWVEEE